MQSTTNNPLRTKAVAFFLTGSVFLLSATTSLAQTTVWTNSGTGDWTNNSNWTGVVPNSGVNGQINQGEAQLSTGGQTVNRLIIGNTTNGQLTVLSGAGLTSTNRLDAGLSGGVGTYEQSGGSVTMDHFRLNTAGSTFTISGGSFTSSSSKSYVAIGTGSSGSTQVNLEGGTLTTTGGNLVMGNSGSGTLRISGGTLNAGNISSEGTGNAGELQVIGSSSVIDLQGDITTNALETFRFEFDASGVSPVQVRDNSDLLGTEFVFDTQTGFSANIGDTFDLVQTGTTGGTISIDSTPTVTNLSGFQFDVSLEDVGGFDTLRAEVTAIPEPTTAGVIFGLGGIALVLLKRRSCIQS